MDAQFRTVKIKHGIAIHQFPAKSIISADSIDFLPCIVGHIDNLMENFLSMKCQVAAADVETGHEEITARRRLRQVDDLPHVACMHAGTGQ